MLANGMDVSIPPREYVVRVSARLLGAVPKPSLNVLDRAHTDQISYNPDEVYA